MTAYFMMTRHHLLDAYNDLTLAYHNDDVARETRLKLARNSLAKALMPDAEGMPYFAGEEWLVDFIATAITDSTDIDCTSESQARYIVDELFKHLKVEGK